MIHIFQSAKSDGADSTLVKPSNWNAVHVRAVNPQSANYTALTTDDYIPVTTGASDKTITLPSAPNTGFSLILKKVDSGAAKVIIAGTIDGATNYWLTTQYQYVEIVYNGSSWDVVGKN